MEIDSKLNRLRPLEYYHAIILHRFAQRTNQQNNFADVAQQPSLKNVHRASICSDLTKDKRQPDEKGPDYIIFLYPRIARDFLLLRRTKLIGHENIR